MNSFKAIITIAVFMLSTPSHALTPAFQGFDQSYVTLGATVQDKQEITVKIDDAPFHFEFTAKLSAVNMSGTFSDYLDQMEFTLMYEKLPSKIGSQDRYFSLVTIIAVLDGEAMEISDPNFSILPPYNKKPKAIAASTAHSKEINAFNKSSSSNIYTQFESKIDDAALIPWNKKRRNQDFTQASTAKSTREFDSQPSQKSRKKLKKLAPLNNAPKPAKYGKIQSPQVAAQNSNNYLNSARSSIPSAHFIQNETTRGLLGFTMLGTAIVSFIQGYLEHSSAQTASANAQALAWIAANANTPAETPQSDVNFQILANNIVNNDDNFQILANNLINNEVNKKDKHIANRNLAWGVGAVSFLSSVVVLNF